MAQVVRVVSVTSQTGGLGIGVIFPGGTPQGVVEAVLANVRAVTATPPRIDLNAQLTPPRWYVWWERQALTARTREQVLNILNLLEDIGLEVRDVSDVRLRDLGPNVLQALPLVFSSRP